MRDCGLQPDLVTPDYCMSLSYPPNAVFPIHWDSRYRWGEYVLGVSMGSSAYITFHPVDKTLQNVRVELPRRSVYVMTGESRTDWKHSLNGVLRPGFGVHAPLCWNPEGMRRSLTFRCTKQYNYDAMQHQLSACLRQPASAERDARAAALQARMAAQRIVKNIKGGQKRNWPMQHDGRQKGPDGKPLRKGKKLFFTPAELADASARAHMLLRALETEPGTGAEPALAAKLRLRLRARDAPFLQHPGVSASTRALYSDDAAPQRIQQAHGAGMAAPPQRWQEENGDDDDDDGADEDDAALQHALAVSAADADALRRAIEASLRSFGAAASRKRGPSSNGGAGPYEVVDLTADDDDDDAAVQPTCAAAAEAPAPTTEELRRARLARLG